LKGGFWVIDDIWGGKSKRERSEVGQMRKRECKGEGFEVCVDEGGWG
jgi:hypothetical protein